MELIIAFIAVMWAMRILSREETLAERYDRMHINALADKSRRGEGRRMRPRCWYIQAGWRPEK